jgi:hypothetical protein
MGNSSLETHFFVKNFTKIYPDRIKVVEYTHGYLKQKPGITAKDLWLIPEQYEQHMALRKQFKAQRKYFVEHHDDEPVLPPEQLTLLDFRPEYMKDPLYIDALTRQNREVVVNETFALIRAGDALKRSLRRSKVNIVDLIACNEFDMFVTFSFGKDHYDIDLCKKRFSQWINYQQKLHIKMGYKPFQYIAVPEYHGDKKAIHFHAMMNDYMGEIVPSKQPEFLKNKITGQLYKNPKEGKQIIQNGKPVFNLKSYTLGYTNMSYIVHKAKTANYITKYVTKELIQLKGQKRFWYSRGLKKPEIVYNDIPDVDLIEIHENEHFKISIANTTIHR